MTADADIRIAAAVIVDAEGRTLLVRKRGTGAFMQAGGKVAADETSAEALPEINFSTFIISLSTQALMHLGEIANPISEKVEIDVPVAKQMIDILAMLKDKSRGNLNASEDRLMEDILFDLRMKYVEAVKKR